MLLRPVSVSLSLPRSRLLSAGNGHFHVPPSPRRLEERERHGRIFLLPQLLLGIEDGSGIFSSVFLSYPSCPSSCVVPGWGSGKQIHGWIHSCDPDVFWAAAMEEPREQQSYLWPLHPLGLKHCHSFPTWKFSVHRGFYCPESAPVTTGQLQELLLCSPSVKKSPL